ncbi:DoxX-like family protein [Mariniblastus sp.]|nr:DoxX-like family protein [Mariniblastus sp.]
MWLYHGLIPKLIFQHATELELINKGPVLGTAELTLMLAGIGEVLVGVCVIAFWKQIWPVYLSLFGFTVLLVASVAISPGHAVHAFNPITLTMSAIFFCAIQITSQREANR